MTGIDRTICCTLTPLLPFLANDVRVPLGAPPSRSDASGDNEDEDDEKEKAKEEPDYICASFADVSTLNCVSFPVFAVWG